MKRILTGQEDLFGPWMVKHNGGDWFPGRGSIIGLWEDNVGPIAAAMYEGHNGASVSVHLTGVGKRWMNREFLWFCFYYPFVQLGVKKLIGVVESDNHDAIRLNHHFGYTLEATLKDAAPRGDLLIFTMTKDQCKWLSLTEQYRGEQTKRPSTP